MIERLDLCRNHAYRLDGLETLEFSPGLNALLGPNGSGKSTVLRALRHCQYCQVHGRGEGARHFFDSETMDPQAPVGPPGSLQNMVLRARALFSSHGQIMRSALL